MGPYARLLGLQIPKRAVYGVARGPSGQDVHETGAIDAAHHRAANLIDLGQHTLDGLVIAAIGHGLATPDKAVLRQLDYNHPSLGLCTARYDKAAGNRPDLLPRRDLAH